MTFSVVREGGNATVPENDKMQRERIPRSNFDV